MKYAKIIKNSSILFMISSIIAFILMRVLYRRSGFPEDKLMYVFITAILIIVFGISLFLLILIKTAYPDIKEYEDLINEARIEELDDKKRGVDTDSNEYLGEKLLRIRKRYEESEEIERTRREKDIITLNRRRNFLENKYYVWSEKISVVLTVVISIISSALYDIINKITVIRESENTVEQKEMIKRNLFDIIQYKCEEARAMTILIVVLIAFVFLRIMTHIVIANTRLKNNERITREYEIKYIDKNIAWIEEHLDEEERDNTSYKEILDFKEGIQAAISKSNIDEDIKTRLHHKISKMSLYVADEELYNKERVSVDGAGGYILYERSTEQDPKLRDYKELEKILDKYDMELNVERNIEA